jgi:hypothetical protein
MEHRRPTRKNAGRGENIVDEVAILPQIGQVMPHAAAAKPPRAMCMFIKFLPARNFSSSVLSILQFHKIVHFHDLSFSRYSGAQFRFPEELAIPAIASSGPPPVLTFQAGHGRVVFSRTSPARKARAHRSNCTARGLPSSMRGFFHLMESHIAQISISEMDCG